MPELPEVESVRRSIEDALRSGLGACVVTGSWSSGSRRVHGVGALDGDRIARLHRHGKQLAIEGRTGPVLLVHLGMSGVLRMVHADRAEPIEKHTHARWFLSRGASVVGELRFVDPRTFGRVDTFASMDDVRRRWRGTLGPDALAVGGEALRAAFARTGRSVKSCLLDQRVLAGVGNIYADESLFRARLSPIRAAASLTRGECAALARALRGVLARAVEAGGSTLRDNTYRDATGRAGEYQSRHMVYGRAERTCKRCSAKLSSCRVAQRATVWCPCCQR